MTTTPTVYCIEAPSALLTNIVDDQYFELNTITLSLTIFLSRIVLGMSLIEDKAIDRSSVGRIMGDF